MRHNFLTRILSFTTVCCVIIFFISFSIMPAYAAGTKQMGDPCNSDSDCASNDCEDSNLSSADDDFCDCDDDKDCSTYGSGPWLCVDGNEKSHDLDFCTSGTQTKYPLPENADKQKPGIIDTIYDPESAIDQRELQDLISAPQPRIKIPGLTFSDPEVVKQNTKTEVGSAGLGTYMSIPYIGEYLAVVYRYAVIVTSVIAVIIIIIQGFIITTSGGSSERINHAKERIGQAVTGLIIAAASYIILFTINPELVQFRNLKVLYIKEEILDVEDASGDYPVTGNAERLCSSENQCKPFCSNNSNWPTLTTAGMVPTNATTPFNTIKISGVKAQSNVTIINNLIEPLKKAGEIALQKGYMLYVISGHRPIEDQLRLACPSILEGKKSGSVSWPGGSNHGSGRAIDIRLMTGDGKGFLSAPTKSSLQNEEKFKPHNKALAEIMYAAGWQRLKIEVWHFEYPGSPVEAARTVSCFETSC